MKASAAKPPPRIRLAVSASYRSDSQMNSAMQNIRSAQPMAKAAAAIQTAMPAIALKERFASLICSAIIARLCRRDGNRSALQRRNRSMVASGRNAARIQTVTPRLAGGLIAHHARDDRLQILE